MNEFEGRLAVVTGGAHGIGQAVVRLLAGRGAAVGVLDVDDERARALTEQITSSGGQALGQVADVRDRESVRTAIDAVEHHLGPVAILVNNAGGNVSRQVVEETTESAWDATIALNLTSAFNASAVVLPEMKRRRSGRIVNLSSVSASQVLGTIVDAAYMSAKAGILGLTQKLAAECAPYGVTVNAVCPGFVGTERIEKTVSAKVMKQRERRVPLSGRMVRPAEVAEAVAFLASDHAAMITGSWLRVDGGLSLGPLDVE